MKTITYFLRKLFFEENYDDFIRLKNYLNRS